MKLRQFLLCAATALVISTPALADVQGDLNG